MLAPPPALAPVDPRVDRRPHGRLDNRPVGPLGSPRPWLPSDGAAPAGLARLAALGALAACSAGARAGDATWGPPPGAHTRAVLVGELCEGGEPCQCRPLDAPGLGGVSGPDDRVPVAGARVDNDPDGASDSPTDAAPTVAAPSARRVELRLRSSHELWLRVGEWTFVKDRERAEACFYIDLPMTPGVGQSYPVELRASNPDGVAAGLVVSELGAAARAWYRTLSWSCGAPGACSFDELEAEKAEVSRAAAERRLYDPCGSLQVLGLRWDSRVAPDHQYPGDLTLAFTLRASGRVPEKAPGDPSCGQ